MRARPDQHRHFSRPVLIFILSLFLMVTVAVGRLFAEPQTKPLQVITTLFPVYDFARQVGGSHARVTLLLPPGIEAHAFEPTPRDIMRISRADLFVFTGKVMEPWVEDVLAAVASSGLAVAEAGQGIELTGKDPHVWLDLENARKMTDRIAEAFIRKDPANREEYLARARAYQARLAALDAECKATLAKTRLRTFVYAGHFAFGYFCRRYQLQPISPYRGVSPDAEPSPGAIAQLLTSMRALGIKYIFYEELAEPKLARVLARETGAALLLLNGAHNIGRDQLAGGKTFLDFMNENLRNLKLGLE